MEKQTVSFRFQAAALAVILAVAATCASAAPWLQVDASGAVTVSGTAEPAAPSVAVVSSDPRGLVVSAETAGLELGVYDDRAGQFVELSWPNAPLAGKIGDPALPVIRRLFVAPDGATVTFSEQADAPVAINSAMAGRNLLVKPVQPPIEKLPGAREAAVFHMNAATYSADMTLPAQRVVVQELGIVRGQHLYVLEIYPVAYNPVAQTLYVYPKITANVQFSAGNDVSPLTALHGLNKIVLNPEVLPASAGRGTGNYLICVAAALEADIAAFAAAKTDQGYTVTTHVVAAGTTNAQLKTYIQSLWGSPATAPDYLLLVGDTNFIPHWTSTQSDNPDNDLYYACMDGTNDWYPDFAVGRFPARTSTQLAAMVNKTLYYENGNLADPQYVKRAVFMASNDNYSVSEGTHNYVISTWLQPNDYTCDKLYCHTYSATTQQVRNAFNNGRFYGIYSGHGSTDSWADGPVFSQSDVNGLTNANLYAWVCSFACLTGQFSLDECFMETWVRAPNKGALLAFGSSVTSYWTEDDILERVLFDAIFDNDDAVPTESGPVIVEAKMRYLAHFGAGGSTRRYFEMYNIMGDPSLAPPSACSDAGQIQLDRSKYACAGTVNVRVADCGLNANPNAPDTVTITIASTSDPVGKSVVLTETGSATATFTGSIGLSTTSGPTTLLVAAGDTITATYIDANNGQGGTNVVVTDTAVVDCTPPTMSNVHVTNLQARTATVAFSTNEPAYGIVHYGLDCGSLNLTAQGGALSTSPTVDLAGLSDNTTYYFKVDAVDEAGNMVSDPNCYTFTTPEVPDYFTQLFTSDNDLRNVSLKFTPNGSGDFYAACNETITSLPTDPAGGTVLSLTDDSFATVTVGSGQHVALYGVNYATFYVGSNGYVTFSSGDSTTSESLDNHFNQPRISGLFDDLNPAAGGQVSWKQLADHVAVTWLNVPEYNTSNQNTVQIEMFFDGRITINYLAVAATDGLAGLSQGQGVPDEFLMSDLTALGPCTPHPPTANNATVNLPAVAPTPITLQATDDGRPNPPGALTYIVMSLPVHGSLAVQGGSAITAVPFTMPTSTHTVVYTPYASYHGTDNFQFKANDGGTPPEGGDSNVATISIVIAAVPEAVYTFALDTNPGWTTTGLWAFGHPIGGGTHNKDPNNGYTGTNVYGYNLNGDYTNNMSTVRYLTTTALNFQNVTAVTLKFWRWLGVEKSDRATIEVSNDGSTWTTVWTNPTDTTIVDAAWTQVTYDISAVANNHATVYVRWVMGPSDGSVTYPGWNIDDVAFWGIVSSSPVVCRADCNCDGVVGFADIDYFVASIPDNQAAWAALYAGQHGGNQPPCPFANCDANGDGHVDFADIDPFVALVPSTCP